MCMLLLGSSLLASEDKDDCGKCAGETACKINFSGKSSHGSSNESAQRDYIYENCIMKLFQTQNTKAKLNDKNDSCHKCMVKHYALNTLEWVRAKMHDDHKKAAMSLVAAGAAVGTVGVLSSAASGTANVLHSKTTNEQIYFGDKKNTLKSSSTSSSTTTTVSHIGLMAALGGGPATLIPTLAIGGSALAVYAGFKLTKEALNRKKCNVSCGFDRLEFSVRNARLMNESAKVEKARTGHNAQLVEIAANHLENSVALFHEAQATEQATGNESLQTLLRRYYDDHYTKDTSSQINYLISLFSGAVDKNVHNAIGTAGKCLLKCPVDLTWKFTCRVIDKLKNMEEVLRLAQMMSYSQNNMISFNTTRTTNLAKFLWMTRSNKDRKYSFYRSISLKYDANRYGTSEKNLCSKLTDLQTSSEGPSRADKMHALIQFQLHIEKKAREHRGEIVDTDKK